MSMFSPGCFPLLPGILACAVAACPPAVRAQTLPWLDEIYINVTGELKEPACTPSLQQELMPGSDNTSSVVSLHAVNLWQLDEAGKTAGGVTIQFRASGCTGHVNNMWVHFTSANVDSAGRIIPNGSSQLRFEFRDNDPSGAFIRVNGNAETTPGAEQGTTSAFSGSHPANSNRVATKSYGVRYYAQNPVTQAGNYSASVTANFKYY